MKKLFFVGMIVVLFTACNKEEDVVDTSNYTPLAIGNYWVYQNYAIDSTGAETLMKQLDSIVVVRDTIIRDQKYYILEGINYIYTNGTWGAFDILRDSSGFLVRNTGEILFSKSNFTDVLRTYDLVIDAHTYYTSTYKMEKPQNKVSVPAGAFEVLNFKGTLYTPKTYPSIDNPRYLNNMYADGVGRILKTFYMVQSPGSFEKRLVRYHIEE